MAHHVVLVVDDEPDQRHICEVALRHEGYHVLHACDGGEAVHITGQLIPDLILMDLHLPRKSGVVAFHEIRRSEQTSEVPIVAMTADVVLYPRASMLALGFDGYISLPCRPTEIVAEVRRLIGPPTVTLT